MRSRWVQKISKDLIVWVSWLIVWLLAYCPMPSNTQIDRYQEWKALNISGDNKFIDFPDNQLTKFHVFIGWSLIFIPPVPKFIWCIVSICPLGVVWHPQDGNIADPFYGPVLSEGEVAEEREVADWLARKCVVDDTGVWNHWPLSWFYSERWGAENYACSEAD